MNSADFFPLELVAAVYTLNFVKFGTLLASLTDEDFNGVAQATSGHLKSLSSTPDIASLTLLRRRPVSKDEVYYSARQMECFLCLRGAIASTALSEQSIDIADTSGHFKDELDILQLLGGAQLVRDEPQACDNRRQLTYIGIETQNVPHLFL